MRFVNVLSVAKRLVVVALVVTEFVAKKFVVVALVVVEFVTTASVTEREVIVDVEMLAVARVEMPETSSDPAEIVVAPIEVFEIEPSAKVEFLILTFFN